jgi:hypothetical protein
VNTPWIERFWCFVCLIFGHKFHPNAGWYYAGKLHCVCGRCNRIISEKYASKRERPE